VWSRTRRGSSASPPFGRVEHRAEQVEQLHGVAVGQAASWSSCERRLDARQQASAGA
jgi:hypothetical protein